MTIREYIAAARRPPRSLPANSHDFLPSRGWCTVKKPGAPDTPAAIEGSKRYLTDFGRLQEAKSSDHELYDAMTQLYPGWVSHQAWLMFGFGAPPSRPGK